MIVEIQQIALRLNAIAAQHTVLLKILREKTHNNRFIRLIGGLLDAGYLEDWKYNAYLQRSSAGRRGESNFVQSSARQVRSVCPARTHSRLHMWQTPKNKPSLCETVRTEYST